MLSELTQAAKDLVDGVKDGLAGAARGLEANIQYQSLLNKLKNPEGTTLTEKKLYALTQCQEAIPHFTNKAAVAFYNDLHKDAKLQYIREEKGFFKLFGEHGNTKTYGEIMRLLKKRVNENYERHTDAKDRNFADDLAEERKIVDLMTSRRGRCMNLLTEVGMNYGETGKFNEEYERRRAPR